MIRTTTLWKVYFHSFHLFLQKIVIWSMSQKHRKYVTKRQEVARTIFLTFPWKTSYYHGHNWPKDANSVKKPVYCRPKKSIGCPFHDFSRKYHYPLAQILSKKRSFSKKHVALMPICGAKNVHSLKTRYSHVIWSKFSWKTTCCHAYDWSRNVNSVETTI